MTWDAQTRRAMLLTLAGVLALVNAAPAACAQATNEAPEEEIVANLAAGRVVIAVVKGAIVIGTLEDPVEPETIPPVIVPISSRRAGVLLGATDWIGVSGRYVLARLSRELPRLRAHGSATAPRLGASEAPGAEASDIEQIGLGLLDRLNEVAEHVHGKLPVEPDEPIVELVLAGYVQSYGAEIWLLKYTLEQEPQRGDYWKTRFLRPTYDQLWPPEKGSPKSLVELHYPPSNAVSLLDLVRTRDARLAAAFQATPEVPNLLTEGESTKTLPRPAIAFLRASLQALASLRERETLGVVSEENGFVWVIPPPEQKGQPEDKIRPPGAPTLSVPPTSPPPKR